MSTTALSTSVVSTTVLSTTVLSTTVLSTTVLSTTVISTTVMSTPGAHETVLHYAFAESIHAVTGYKFLLEQLRFACCGRDWMQHSHSLCAAPNARSGAQIACSAAARRSAGRRAQPAETECSRESPLQMQRCQTASCCPHPADITLS